MRIRPATSLDAADVQRMVAALYTEDPSPHFPTPQHVTRTLARLSDPQRGAVLVVDSGAPPAFGYVFLARVWSNELGGDIVIIDELWVAPEQRGKGVGSALVQEAMRTMSDAVAFELESTPDNDRARALYERLGFRTKKNQSMRLVR